MHTLVTVSVLATALLACNTPRSTYDGDITTSDTRDSTPDDVNLFDGEDASDSEDIPDTTASTDTSIVDPNCTILPKLSDIHDKYFSRSCTFGGCHDSGSRAGDLNLQDSGLHTALVNVPAADPKAGPRGKVRVVPGAPNDSFFLQKLEGTMARDEGNLMPDGADEPIDPNCRIQMVRQWITDGALDN